MEMDSTELSVSEWKKKCQEEQEIISKLLSDRIWDKFVKGKDDKYLFQKIALPLFGPPTKDAEDFGLTSEQKKLVDDIMEKCYKHSVDDDNTCVAVIFVFVRVNNGPHTFVPLIRVRNRANEDLRDVPNNIFIDHLGRVYESWRKYKEENTWERSWLCVPKDGYYSSEQEVEFINQSNRRNTRNLALKTGNLNCSQSFLFTAKGWDSPSSTSIFEVDTATERAISAPVFTELRESSPIESSTDEARNHWLNRTLKIAFSAGIDHFTEALQKKGKEGELVSPGRRVIFDALNVGKLIMEGVGLYSSLTSNGNIILDSIEHIDSIISFFTHNVLKFKCGNRIFEDAQDEKIKEMRESLNSEKRPVFDAILQGTKENVEKGKVEHIKGKAAFIKEMGSCEVDLDELFSQIKLLPNGQLNINDELTIHARAYTQMQQKEKDSLLRMSKLLRENKITVADFNSDISDIQKKYRIRFDRQRLEGIDYLKEKFNVGDVSEINIGGTKLGNCKPEVLDRLENVVRNSFHGDPELIKLANTFSKKQGVATVTEYCAAGEYVVRKVETEVKLLQQNPNPTRDKEKDHYKSMVVNELLKDGDKMKKLIDLFNNLCSVCDKASVGSPEFQNPMSGANQYDKHPSFPEIDPNYNLSPERYFEIAAEMAGGPVTDIKWTQDGSSLCCTFISKKYGAMSIRYDNLANKTSVIATLMAYKSKEIILIDSEAK